MLLRTMPQACLTWVSVVSSVMRRPLWYCGIRLFACNRVSICVREPCTTTRRTPRPASRFKSAASIGRVGGEQAARDAGYQRFTAQVVDIGRGFPKAADKINGSGRLKASISNKKAA